MSNQPITFQKLGLPKSIISSIVDAGYSTPTPVQAQAIPIAMAGHDLIASAQTGTGKTAAFVLPMLSKLISDPRQIHKYRPVRVLVLTPTRELAKQVEEAVRTYGKHSKFRSISIFGGTNIGNQLRQLKRGADIVVATPGRLLDHINRGSLDLGGLDILVLDEADRMLDMGFLPDLRRIISELPRDRQTLLFSATMPKEVQKLANTIMFKPQLIEVGERRNPAETVSQLITLVDQNDKIEVLQHLLATEKTESVLVFTRTKYRADRISRKIEKLGYSTTVMHSNRSQNQRERALQGFKSGKYKILVATDVAARGLDVDCISHVVNFDTPDQPEDYIHRIGRTGRAETEGNAITLVSGDEQAYLARIEKHIGKKLDRVEFDHIQTQRENRSYTSGGSSKSGGRGQGGRGQGGGGRRKSSSRPKSYSNGAKKFEKKFSKNGSSSSSNGQRKTEGSSGSERSSGNGERRNGNGGGGNMDSMVKAASSNSRSGNRNFRKNKKRSFSSKGRRPGKPSE